MSNLEKLSTSQLKKELSKRNNKSLKEKYSSGKKFLEFVIVEKWAAQKDNFGNKSYRLNYHVLSLRDNKESILGSYTCDSKNDDTSFFEKVILNSLERISITTELYKTKELAYHTKRNLKDLENKLEALQKEFASLKL